MGGALGLGMGVCVCVLLAGVMNGELPFSFPREQLMGVGAGLRTSSTHHRGLSLTAVAFHCP